MRKGCIDGLTPVECLYLLADHNEEKYTHERALAAILANLYENDLIDFSQTRECKLNLTKKGENALRMPEILRAYEVGRLKGIQNDDCELIYNFNSGDIKDELVKRNIMKKYIIEEPVKIFGKTIFRRRKLHYEYYPETKLIIEKLKEMCNELINSISKGTLKEWTERYGKSMSYAFPSVAMTDGFKKLAQEIRELAEWKKS